MFDFKCLPGFASRAAREEAFAGASSGVHRLSSQRPFSVLCVGYYHSDEEERCFTIFTMYPFLLYGVHHCDDEEYRSFLGCDVNSYLGVTIIIV